MLCESKALKLIELFITCDDFCKALTQWQTQQCILPTGRAGQLTDSEMMTILVFYHHSGYKCFQYYYHSCVESQLKSYFPHLITYERFVARMPRLLPGLFLLLKWLCANSERTGFYIIDSKPLAVCHNKRIHLSSGFGPNLPTGALLHGVVLWIKNTLVINQYGQLINFMLTPGNVADNNGAVLTETLDGLRGQCFGDRGYLTKLFAQFYEQGLQLVTKLRRRHEKHTHEVVRQTQTT